MRQSNVEMVGDIIGSVIGIVLKYGLIAAAITGGVYSVLWIAGVV